MPKKTPLKIIIRDYRPEDYPHVREYYFQMGYEPEHVYRWMVKDLGVLRLACQAHSAN